MLPFDIREALAGKTVVQRNSMAACVIGVLEDRVIVEMNVLEDDGYFSQGETSIRTTVDMSGRYKSEQLIESPQDLFMVGDDKEGKHGLRR